MRWHRSSTVNHHLQPSTSYAAVSDHNENRVPNPHRRQKFHRPERIEAEFTSSDEHFFVRSNSEHHNAGMDTPRLYAGNTHSGNHQPRGASTASVIVFAFALSGILLVFLLFYFLAKVCSPANEEDLKDPQSESIASGLAIRKGTTTRKNATGVQDSPQHVLFPRRIYELKAEEGCYSSLPSMKTPEIQDDVVVFKKSSSPSSKRKHFKQLVRKLTTTSAPSADLFTPSNSPRFSTCSET